MLIRWIKALFKPALGWPALVGLLLVVSGIYFFESYEASHQYSDKMKAIFLSELGFAFLIAVILFIILEERAGREHSKTVLGYLYNIDPGDKYFKKIVEYVIKKPFFRIGTTVTYEVKDKDGESLLFEYTIEYRVKNVSRETKPFQVRGIIDKKPIHKSSDLWNDDLGVTLVACGDESAARGNPALKIEQGRKESHCETYIMDPVAIEPGHERAVKAVHRLVKHDHDSEVWQSSIPSSGVKFELLWSEEVQIVCAIEAIHPEAEKWKPTELDKGRRLIIDAPLLANHGVHFWWSAKAREPDAAAPTEAAPA